MAEAAGNLLEVILFMMMVTSTLIFALNLFALELIDAVCTETLNALLDIVFILALLFTYCYLSECMTSDLLEIGDIFYNSEWYRLRVKEQKLMAFPIQRAQSVFRLKGLGLLDCSLAVFSSVKIGKTF